MNIYKLNHNELNKLHNEFNSTSFGKRAKIFSMLPFGGVILALILVAVDVVENDGITIIGNMWLCLCFLSLSILAITQLQYGNMLKEYAQSKKEKE